jgi:restriction system protein
MFVAQGYQIAQAAGEAPHRAVDLVLRKNRETFLVQCKQWRDAKVGIDACEALYGIMKSRNALGGFIVTTGRFSRESAAYASSCNIRLIDGTALDGAMKKAQARIKA